MTKRFTLIKNGASKRVVKRSVAMRGLLDGASKRVVKRSVAMRGLYGPGLNGVLLLAGVSLVAAVPFIYLGVIMNNNDQYKKPIFNI